MEGTGGAGTGLTEERVREGRLETATGVELEFVDLMVDSIKGKRCSLKRT